MFPGSVGPMEVVLVLVIALLVLFANPFVH